MEVNNTEMLKFEVMLKDLKEGFINNIDELLKVLEVEENKKKEVKANYTLEKVRFMLAKIARSGKQKEVKELVSSFGVEKLSDIKSEDYDELAKKAEEI